MYVGLTASPERLLQLRRTRLRSDSEEDQKKFEENEYLDQEKIEEEVRRGRRIFSKRNWSVIDVTKRSIEETAAEILALYQAHQEKRNG